MTASVTATVPAGTSRRSLRRVAIWVALGAVATLGVMFGARPMLDDDEAPVDASLQAVARAYRADVEPVLEDGASVVALGLKPGVADVAARAYADNVLVTMADGWIRSLEAVRDELDAISPAAALEDVHWLYVRALDTYVQTARAVRAAIDAVVGPQLDALIDLAAQLGRSADQLYDRADAWLDRLDTSNRE